MDEEICSELLFFDWIKIDIWMKKIKISKIIMIIEAHFKYLTKSGSLINQIILWVEVYTLAPEWTKY